MDCAIPGNYAGTSLTAKLGRILFSCAALCLVLPLHAQFPMSCVMTLVSTPTVRSEGLTERMGDILVRCTGGNPLASGQVLPTANITVLYNANVTSHITNASNNASEALLVVDDPPAAAQVGCPVSGGCPAVLSTGGASNPYLASGAPNVYQGTVSGNQVNFLGVPIDPPGTSQHTYRIVNLRVAAGTASSSTISVAVSSSGPSALNIQNAVGTAATRTSGLTATLRDGGSSAILAAPVQWTQCQSVNAALASSNSAGSAPQGNTVVIRLTENFAAAFRARNSAAWSDADTPPLTLADATTPPTGETGFYNGGLPATDGMNTAGTVASGTKFYLRLDNLPKGVVAYTSLYEIGKTAADSRVRLVSSSTLTEDAYFFSKLAATSPVDGGMAPMAPFPSPARFIAMYEVTGFAAESNLDTAIDVPVLLAYDPSLGYAPTGTISATAEFAVRSADDQATSDAAVLGDRWVPRFLDIASPQPIVDIGACPLIPVTVSPAMLAFGNQGVSSNSAAQTVTVSNNLNTATNLSFTIDGDNPADFPQTGGTCGATLAGLSSCTIAIQFDPQAIGPRSAKLSFSGTADATQPEVDLTGTGVATTAITLISDPAGLLVSVDGAAAVLTPATVNLTAGAHTIAVDSPQPGSTGTQYVFTKWSDSGAASHTITVGSSPATYKASFKTQYQLTMTLFPATAGAVAPPSGSYFDVGVNVAVSATAVSGYAFGSWTGPVQDTASASTLVPINGPVTLLVNYVAVAPTVFQTIPSGLPISVDGGAEQVAPFTAQLAPGVHTVAVATTQAGGKGSQSVFANWSDSGSASHSITVNASPQATYTATFKTQYQLTTVASPKAGGSVTPASGFYDSGAVVNLVATPASGYSLGAWTGAVANPAAVATTITMGSPQFALANFSSFTGITLQTVPAGLPVVVDFSKAQKAPFTTILSQGMHHIDVPGLVGAGVGFQYRYASWSDGGAQGHQIVVGAAAATYTANFTTQYQLLTSVLPSNPIGGSVTLYPVAPFDGFYDALSNVTVTAVPASGFLFSGFAGALSGPTNPQTLTMSAPSLLTANFTPADPAISVSISKLSTYQVFPSCFGSCRDTDVTILLSNTGPGTASTVSIDSIVATIISGSGSLKTSCIGSTCSVGTISPGGSSKASATITISGSVTKFSVLVSGTMQDSVGATLNFSGAGQIVP